MKCNVKMISTKMYVADNYYAFNISNLKCLNSIYI